MCTAVSMLQHYFWTSAFLWTSIISFDTCVTFTSLTCNPGAANNRKRYLIAWACPATYVAVCASVSFTCNTPTIVYGSREACFISKGVFYYFGIPLIVCITVNVVCYTLTIIALRNAARNASKLRSNVNQNDQHSLLIYLRLSSVMGFAWVFGFAANFVPYLWYPFIMLNTLQGVFICFSLVLSPASRKLWKQSVESIYLSS